jgi:hypothetical protein
MPESRDERLEYGKIREERRREWAALQNPELVTTQQALQILHRKNGAGFSDFMKENNVTPQRHAGFISANFYVKEEVEKLAERLFLKGHVFTRSVKKSYKSAEKPSPKRVTFESMKDGKWTIEEFIEAWGAGDTSHQVESLISRAPSILKLSPLEAQQLLLLLSRLGGPNFRITGFKYDKVYFLREIRKQVKDDNERRKLAQIMDSLYESTDIGVFDPSLLVKILYELMASKPKSRPSAS